MLTTAAVLKELTVLVWGNWRVGATPPRQHVISSNHPVSTVQSSGDEPASGKRTKDGPKMCMDWPGGGGLGLWEK